MGKCPKQDNFFVRPLTSTPSNSRSTILRMVLWLKSTILFTNMLKICRRLGNEWKWIPLAVFYGFFFYMLKYSLHFFLADASAKNAIFCYVLPYVKPNCKLFFLYFPIIFRYFRLFFFMVPERNIWCCEYLGGEDLPANIPLRKLLDEVPKQNFSIYKF